MAAVPGGHGGVLPGIPSPGQGGDRGRFFAREILPYQGLTADETIRDTSLKAMAELQPLQEGGTITAAVSSQTCDGASAVLVVSEEALARYKLTPRARVVHMTVRAEDPIWMLTAPIPATRRAIERSGIALGDIDLVEINEAFAPVPMAWLAETGYPLEQTNVNGGAIALGHPCLLYTSPSPRDRTRSRMPSSA